MRSAFTWSLLATLIFAGPSAGPSAGAESVKAAFRLLSPAFGEGGAIPAVYSATRGGKDISPPLAWVDPPAGTKSFAIVCEDLINVPLIGFITHWVLYDIPSGDRELEEAVPRAERLPDGSVQGRNFNRECGYMGPSPLSGTHRYRFRIYALDSLIGEAWALDKRQLRKAMEGHILGQADLTGVYARQAIAAWPR
jgi:Raf kinase inhibitor-like YbhB/YbcL family protein